ncbi:collagen alpha-4(IV) chain-like [Dendropsophus ebraccatus]|uniref:collagen alpha-4(IV) chain-like n=1 Tax=Dendropsophus ebraccatus TaxID=150705 RepID=UPI003831930B
MDWFGIFLFLTYTLASCGGAPWGEVEKEEIYCKCYSRNGDEVKLDGKVPGWNVKEWCDFPAGFPWQIPGKLGLPGTPGTSGQITGGITGYPGTPGTPGTITGEWNEIPGTPGTPGQVTGGLSECLT